MKRIFRVTAIHRQWLRERSSPFAQYQCDYSDPSAAHEHAMWCKKQGMHNVLITPMNAETR